MNIFRGYKDSFSLETVRSVEEITAGISRNFSKTRISGNRVVITHNPSPFNLFAGRGTTIIDLMSSEKTGRTMVTGQVRPSLLNLKTDSILVLLILGGLTILLINIPLSIFSLIGFFLVWLLMALAAPYMLFLILVLWTMLVMFNSFESPLIVVVAGWIIFFLLTHILLIHNQKQLKAKLIRFFRKLNKGKGI
jgi:hypothetical protein